MSTAVPGALLQAGHPDVESQSPDALAGAAYRSLTAEAGVYRRPSGGIMEALPSLPRVPVRILDVLQDENADLSALSTVILQDLGLTTRIIAAARSTPGEPSRFESVEQAVRTLGLSAVKALVITTAMQQVFERFSPRRQSFLNEV